MKIYFIRIFKTDAINIKGVKSKNKTTKVKAGVNKVTVEPLSQYVWIKK